jgi:transposase
MDFYLDALLNLPNITVESCTQSEQQVVLKLRLLNETSDCPHCQNQSDKLHQNRPVLIRDLPISGQTVHLHLPRRQFYCSFCQRYFTERLNFVDWERRYTTRYENAIYHRVQTTSIEQVSREEDLSWDQVQGIFNHKFGQEKKQIGAKSND